MYNNNEGQVMMPWLVILSFEYMASITSNSMKNSKLNLKL
jgi:hypothetical protein